MVELLNQVEVLAPAAGVFVGGIVAAIIHIRQRRHARILPFLPSYSALVEQELTSATRFLSSVHELTMCVTEAWNMRSGRRTNAASVEALLKRAPLQNACAGVMEHGAEMMASFDGFQTLSVEARIAASTLSSVWKYNASHNYRTERYTVTSRDSKGNTRRQTKTRQVYESTDHTFVYDAVDAHRAERLLTELKNTKGKVVLNHPNVGELCIKLDALSQAERMFLERMYVQTVLEDEQATPTAGEMESAINQWLVGAALDGRLASCERHIIEAIEQAPASLEIIRASKSRYHYRTKRKTHSGPEGYQAAKHLQGLLQDAEDDWLTISAMWTTCQNAAQSVLAWAEDPEKVESDKDYAREAVAAYKAAFPLSSIDVDQLTTPRRTTLIALAVAVAVAVVVALAHPGGPLN